MNQVKAELRQSRSGMQDNLQLRELLAKAATNPDELLATPSRLLEAQPGLRRLKDGLVDAQLRTAALLGRMSKDHPSVIAATRAEQEVRTNLHAEVASALRGVDADLEVAQSQLDELNRQHDDLQQRLDQLASLRARYSNLVDDLRQRTEIVQKAKKSLADARASQTGALSSSQLTRFHDPETGNTPIGPGRLTIVAAGLFGGLATGAGLVFLVIPLGPVGRRATDRMLGRRAEDRNSSPVIEPRSSNNPAPGRRGADTVEVAQPPSQNSAPQRRRGSDLTVQSVPSPSTVQASRESDTPVQPRTQVEETQTQVVEPQTQTEVAPLPSRRGSDTGLSNPDRRRAERRA